MRNYPAFFVFFRVLTIDVRHECHKSCTLYRARKISLLFCREVCTTTIVDSCVRIEVRSHAIDILIIEMLFINCLFHSKFLRFQYAFSFRSEIGPKDGSSFLEFRDDLDTRRAEVLEEAVEDYRDRQNRKLNKVDRLYSGL